MAGETIVFFPKYTTLVEGTYYSDPYELTSYLTGVIEIMNVAIINSATVTLQMEQSSDLITWTNLGSSVAPTAGNILPVSISGPSRYVRAKVTIGAAGGSATIWCKGVARDAQGHGLFLLRWVRGHLPDERARFGLWKPDSRRRGSRRWGQGTEP